MPSELSGLKISSKETSLIISDQNLGGGDTFRLRLVIRDTDGARDLCPIQEISQNTSRIAAGPDAGKFELKVQNTSEGPVLGFSDSGHCALVLELLEVTSNGPNPLLLDAQIRVKMSSTAFYYTPSQRLQAPNDSVLWVVSN